MNDHLAIIRLLESAYPNLLQMALGCEKSRWGYATGELETIWEGSSARAYLYRSSDNPDVIELRLTGYPRGLPVFSSTPGHPGMYGRVRGIEQKYRVWASAAKSALQPRQAGRRGEAGEENVTMQLSEFFERNVKLDRSASWERGRGGTATRDGFLNGQRIENIYQYGPDAYKVIFDDGRSGTYGGDDAVELGGLAEAIRPFIKGVIRRAFREAGEYVPMEFDETIGEWVAKLPDGREIIGKDREDVRRRYLDALRVMGKHQEAKRKVTPGTIAPKPQDKPGTVRAATYKDYQRLVRERQKIISDNAAARMRRGGGEILPVPPNPLPPLIPIAYDTEGGYIGAMDAWPQEDWPAFLDEEIEKLGVPGWYVTWEEASRELVGESRQLSSLFKRVIAREVSR
jgi:hypothetical protein